MKQFFDSFIFITAHNFMRRIPPLSLFIFDSIDLFIDQNSSESVNLLHHKRS